jgi:hypothetical protein
MWDFKQNSDNTTTYSTPTLTPSVVLGQTPTLQSLTRLWYHIKYILISTPKAGSKGEVVLTYLYTQQPGNLNNVGLQTHFNSNNIAFTYKFIRTCVTFVKYVRIFRLKKNNYSNDFSNPTSLYHDYWRLPKPS